MTHPPIRPPIRPPTRHHRALFLSDLHLGGPGCKADRILCFLRANSADRLYLAGDILDLWHTRRPQWGADQDAVLGLIRQRAAQGTKVVFLAGNHDVALLRSDIAALLGFPVQAQAIHRTAGGKSFLVLHGDICDLRPLRSHLATRIGCHIDGALRGLDRALRQLRRDLPPDHRSLIERLLAGVNAAVAHGSAHERRLVALARASGQDGVICGHFHKPALTSHDGLIYANCGDWVDSMTALAEDAEGRLRLIGWAGQPVADPDPAPLPGMEAAL